jgi:ubiquinone/menaquinone biosynthesis C-methylase UbiE
MSFRSEWFERVLLPLDVKHLAGPKRVDCGEDELVVVCLVRDGAYHIGPFLEHYRALGARHVFLLDNGSADGTVARGSAAPNVSVFQTRLPFRGNDVAMRRYLVRTFTGTNRWVLFVDIDELFDYPSSRRLHVGWLLRYLRDRRYSTMVSYMLDMLPDGKLSEGDRGLPMREAYPCYDVSGVEKDEYDEPLGYHHELWVGRNTVSNPEIKRYTAGIRARLFDLPEVYLIKHPLMRKDGRAKLVHQHFVDRASVADVSGVLYHYKFVPGFREKVEAAVRGGQYANESWEYKRYQAALEREAEIDFRTAGARRLGSVDELVASGFLQVTDDYRRWVEEHAGEPAPLPGRTKGKNVSASSHPDRVGKFYDRTNDKFVQVYGQVIQAFRTKDVTQLLDYQIESIGFTEGQHVLDAGCGVCGPALYFAKKAGVTVEAVTVSGTQVEAARKRIGEEGMTERVKVQRASYQDLATLFPAETFDAVYFLESFGHSDDIERTLKQVWPVLKQGGTLYIKDLFRKEAVIPSHALKIDDEIRKIDAAYQYNVPDLYHFLKVVRKLGYILQSMKTIDLPLQDFENLTISNDFQELTGIGKIENWKEYIFPVDFFEVKCMKPVHDVRAGNSRYFLQNLYHLKVLQTKPEDL